MNLDQILITSISRLNSHKLVDLSRIKHTVIIPILRGLDWDDTNPDVFWPKYRSSNCLFDYALLFSGTPLVLIKCCQIKNMESGEIKYLFDHANDERVISLILTNGNRWDIFLCDNKGSSEDNLIFSIDLTKEENINNYTKNLNLLLGYNSVISGKSRTFAENLVSEKQERKKAKEMVSKAWDSILVEPDEILVELLIESVENLCGFKPDVDYVKTFLRDKREDTIPSYRADPETDRINIFTEEISKLSHTRLTSARFGDFRPARLNWKSIQILALTSVLDVCKDLEELRRISRANIVEGIKTDMGYTYIQSHRFSCQLKSAPRTAETVIHCAKFLRYELYLDFEWSSNPKSSYPGKKDC